MPLHWRRQWARRFNQSALLAEVIANASGSGGLWGAQAGQGTPQQVGLASRTRDERAGRLPRAADGKPEVAGRKLLLIDDVLTSGATVDACARALLRAGAANVDVLVFARVVAAVRPPI